MTAMETALSNKEGNMGKISGLFCPAWGVPGFGVVENDLESMQKLVGGYIEVVTISRDPKLILICDEEGLLKGKAINSSVPDLREFRYAPQMIAGDCFICGASEDGEFASLPGGMRKELLNKALNNGDYIEYIKKIVSEQLT